MTRLVLVSLHGEFPSEGSWSSQEHRDQEGRPHPDDDHEPWVRGSALGGLRGHAPPLQGHRTAGWGS